MKKKSDNLRGDFFDSHCSASYENICILFILFISFYCALSCILSTLSINE